jgi:hypothetical protein
MHLSWTIFVQGICDSINELKRLIDDVILYHYITHDDLMKTLEAIPTHIPLKLWTDL